MKKITVCIALAGLLALGGQAIAEIGTIDDVPAATLLLPYFEVDLDDPQGVTTLFSINNASAAPALAHVTVWTDMSVPVLDFDVYLTGYDVQTMNMRDIVNGILPVTAEENFDSDPDGPTATAVSNNGADTGTVLGNPEDGNFPGTSGPCAGVAYTPLGSGFVNGHLIPSLTGGTSSLSGTCVSAAYGDNIARGYVTVDLVNACNLLFPSDGDAYFLSVAAFDNILWGDYFYVDAAENFAQGETLVHIEACSDPSVGNGAGHCPFGLGDFTFYSRYVANSGTDQREGLASQFAARYLQGGVFDGGTDYIVWRDSRSTDTTGGATCEDSFAWFPLNQELVVAFDEEENSEELCFTTSDVSPPTGGQETCFPIEAARYDVANSIVPGSQTLGPSFDFGWMFLDLDLTSAARSQAWVTVVMDAEGRFSVGADAIQLDNVSQEPLVLN